jgi:hypothetical protein
MIEICDNTKRIVILTLSSIYVTTTNQDKLSIRTGGVKISICSIVNAILVNKIQGREMVARRLQFFCSFLYS